MSEYEFGRLAYLVLLGVAVGGYFFAQGRENLGKTAQQAMLWGLIFIGLIGGYGLWNDIRDDVAPRQSYMSGDTVEIPRSFDGHYYVVLRVNNEPIRFVVDTGATDIVLTKDDALAVGIDPADLAFSGTASTANGIVRTAPARVQEIRLGEMRDQDVQVFVNEGAMAESLLGMAYLQRFDKIEISDGRMLLSR